MRIQDDLAEGAGTEVGGSGDGVSGEKSFISGTEEEGRNEKSLRTVPMTLGGTHVESFVDRV